MENPFDRLATDIKIFDLMAQVGRIARERGQRLDITDDPDTGLPVYRLVDTEKYDAHDTEKYDTTKEGQ